MAKIAAGVSKWVKRVQEYAVQPPSGLVTNAQRALEVRRPVRALSGRQPLLQPAMLPAAALLPAPVPAPAAPCSARPLAVV